MKSKNYDEASVIRTLSKNRDIRVDNIKKCIDVAKGSNIVGNGTWGKIDYLCNYHGYVYVFVKKVITSIRLDEDGNPINAKMAKREKKLNMAAMAKSAMKRAKTK